MSESKHAFNDYPVGNRQDIEQTVQEIRDAWGDE